MIKTFGPLEGLPITLECDDPEEPTTFWVRPVMEREASALRVSIGDKDAASPEVERELRAVALGQIVAIENIRYNGRQYPRIDELDLVREVIASIPKGALDQLVSKALDVCMLSGEYAKNSSGSSAFIDSDLHPVSTPASTNAASAVVPFS